MNAEIGGNVSEPNTNTVLVVTNLVWNPELFENQHRYSSVRIEKIIFLLSVFRFVLFLFTSVDSYDGVLSYLGAHGAWTSLMVAATATSTISNTQPISRGVKFKHIIDGGHVGKKNVAG